MTTYEVKCPCHVIDILILLSYILSNFLAWKIDIFVRFTVIHVSKDDSLSKVAQEVGHPFDFSMCNPPFFTDEADASPTGKGRHATRSLPKGSNCPGKHEAITDGGEVAIVKRMIEDSFHLMDKIK